MSNLAPNQSLAIFPEDLIHLTVSQLAHLPANQLAEATNNLDQLSAWVKQTRAKLDAALDQRYGESCHSALRNSNRDFGVTHLHDEGVKVTFDLPKRVHWDQALLLEIANHLAKSGKKVEDYMEIELTVAESRFKAWPPELQEQFAPARTVKAGKVSFKLTLVNE